MANVASLYPRVLPGVLRTIVPEYRGPVCAHKDTAIFAAGKSSRAGLPETRDCWDCLCRTVKPVQVGCGHQDIWDLLYESYNLLAPLVGELLVYRTEVRRDLLRETGMLTLLAHHKLERRDMGERIHGVWLFLFVRGTFWYNSFLFLHASMRKRRGKRETRPRTNTRLYTCM
jgi:hypothetical protein